MYISLNTFLTYRLNYNRHPPPAYNHHRNFRHDYHHDRYRYREYGGRLNHYPKVHEYRDPYNHVDRRYHDPYAHKGHDRDYEHVHQEEEELEELRLKEADALAEKKRKDYFKNLIFLCPCCCCCYCRCQRIPKDEELTDQSKNGDG